MPEWFVEFPKWIQQFVFQIYQTFIYADRWKLFADGLQITFIVTIGALFLGIIIGLIFCVIENYPKDDKIVSKVTTIILINV